jgi:hypothetical protein
MGVEENTPKPDCGQRCGNCGGQAFTDGTLVNAPVPISNGPWWFRTGNWYSAFGTRKYDEIHARKCNACGKIELFAQAQFK